MRLYYIRRTPLGAGLKGVDFFRMLITKENNSRFYAYICHRQLPLPGGGAIVNCQRFFAAVPFSIAIRDESFDAIFHAHYRLLYAYALGIVRDRELARDIVQEVFLKLWRNRQRIEINTSLKAYLIRMTRNQCVDTLRDGRYADKNIHIEEVLCRVELMGLDDTDPVFDRIFSDELQFRFREAVETLPAQCKKIFLLNRQEGLSYLEIAAVLGVSHSTVKNQMVIAMRKLHEALKPFL